MSAVEAATPAVDRHPAVRLAGCPDGRLGGAGQHGPAPDVPPRAGARRRSRRQRPRRAAALRLQQHPLRHEHPHRRVGPRQDDPLRAAHARRRAAPLGLRIGGQASPPLLPVAAAGEHPGRDDRAARRRGARRRPLHPGRPRDRRHPPGRGRRRHADRRRHRGAADARGARRTRASLVRDGQQTMLDAREVKSHDEITLLNTACAMVDGAYQLSPSGSSRASARASSSRTSRSASSTWAPSTSTTSTRSPASAARPTRTCSPTASSGPATRPSSTSSRPTSATRPATTGRSSSGTATRRPARRVQAGPRSGSTRRSS